MSEKFRLTADVLNETGALESLDVAGAGGIVTFTGRVRAQSRGREVTSLEYEAYPEMVELVLAQIGAESKERFAIGDIVIHHRVGTLAVGEISVVIAVAAPHRTAAFDAASYAIDRLKQIAPIWKKEHSPDGAVWIEDRP